MQSVLFCCRSKPLTVFVIPLQSDIIVHVGYVWVRKASLAFRGFYLMVRELRRWRHHGKGGGGSRGRAGGKMQQQVRLCAVEVQGLGAVFTAAGLLSSPDKVLECSISRSISLS